MKKLALILLLSLIIPQTFAQSTSGYLDVGPIVGYERVQKILPTPHTKDRLVYGIRAVYGPPIIAVEAEVTQANDTEDYPLSDLSFKETATNAKLGIRSTFLRNSYFTTYLRAGGHARKSKIERTQSGVTTITEPAVTISPYAGTGISVNLMNVLKVNLGVTAIFTGEPKGSDREYQTTFGFTVKI